MPDGAARAKVHGAPEGLRAPALGHGGNPGVAGDVPGAAHPARGTRRGEADPLWGRGQVRHQGGFAPRSAGFRPSSPRAPRGCPGRE